MSAALRTAAFVLTASFTACSLGFGENFSGGPESADGGADDASTGDASTDAGDGGIGNDGAPDADPKDVARGLLLHYRLDESSGDAVLDSAPKLNHAKLLVGSAGPPARVTGVRGGALSFASGSRVEAPYHPSLVLGSSFTVAMWVNAPAVAGSQPRLIAFGDAFDLKLNGRGMQLTLEGQYGAVKYELPADRWTHYAAVFTAGRVKWFVDGYAVEDATVTFDGTRSPQLTPAYPIRLADSTGMTDPYTGVLDDVRVYSVALTPQEVALLAQK